MHKPSSLRDYLVAASMAAGLLVVLGGYLYARHGYLFGAPAGTGTFYLPNRALAGAAAAMLAAVFLVGPLSRYFDRFDQWLGYRKEIGIVGGVLAVLHGVVSAWFVPEKFSLEWLFSEKSFWTASAGLVGAAVLVALAALSPNILIRKVGGTRWWLMQRWGLRIAVVATLLHVLPMKWNGWAAWLAEGGRRTSELARPEMPPAGLFVALFLAWVAAVRTYESAFLFRSAGWRTREIGADAVLLARGRRFVLSTLALLAVCYVVLAGAWLLRIPAFS
jgi:DMSO/TMAO reductase YedYZ heme-binding membrane subunit